MDIFDSNKVLVFSHLEKTGGTRFSNALKLWVKHKDLDPQKKIIVVNPAGPFVDENLVRRFEICNVVQGHETNDRILSFIKGRNRFLLTIVREPAFQLYSYYRFRYLMPPASKGFRLWYSQDFPLNPQARQLIRYFPSFVDKDAVSMARRADSVLEHFDAVIPTDHLSAVLARLSEVSGVDLDRAHGNIGGSEDVIAFPSRADIERERMLINRDHAVDHALYETALHRSEASIERLVDFLATAT